MYNYTTEGCFKGKLLKEPPLKADDPNVKARLEKHPYKSMVRRWYHNGCAMEEVGRMGYPANLFADDTMSKLELSCYVHHLAHILSTPQPIANNDGYHPAPDDGSGVLKFTPRFVTIALVDQQIKAGLEKVLVEYLGFKQLAPYFGNDDSYGKGSRIGLYGLCCTRYLTESKKNE